MTEDKMKRRFLLMGLAGVVGALIATLPILTASAAPTLPMTASITTSDFMFSAADGTSTVNIATGGTVNFSYPTGSSEHNVDFGNGPQPTSCTLNGADQAPPIPAAATAPGWSGSCTFNTPGTYTFHCDKHTFMTGTVVVGGDATTTTTDTGTQTQPGGGGTTTGTGPTTTTMPMNMPMPMPSPGGSTTTTKTGTSSKPAPSPLAGSAGKSIEIATIQKGNQVRGTVKVSAAGRGGHVIITVLASRSGLKHGSAHGKQLVTLGSKRLNGLRAGTTKFTVTVGGTGRKALTSYRRLATIVDVKVAAAKSQTVTYSKSVVLRAG
jgi:plastocyanin